MGKFSKGVKTNLVYIISDFICGIIATLFAGVIADTDIFGKDASWWIVTIIFTLLCIYFNKGSQLYNITLFFYIDRIVKYVTKTFVLVTAMVSILLFYIGHAELDPYFYAMFVCAQYLCLMISAFIQRYIMKKNYALAPRTLLLGDIKRYDKFIKFVNRSSMNINIIGFISLYGESKGYLGGLENLEKIIHDNAIDKVFFMERNSVNIDIQPYIDLCMDMGVIVDIIMGSYRSVDAHSYISSIGTYPVITYHKVVLNLGSQILKRMMDIVGSAIGILVFSPVMLIASVAIKIEDSKGSVFFKQKRVGQNGRAFYIYKFRSMCSDAEEKKKELMELNEMGSDFMFKMKDDPRITRVGKILRKTNIDELPQFFNVLFGDMSLVGTRPPTFDEALNYATPHWRRVSIKPGITGMWQVSGRSEITDFDEVVELDTEYIDKWSIYLDIRILFKTVFQMFSRDNGAY